MYNIEKKVCGLASDMTVEHKMACSNVKLDIKAENHKHNPCNILQLKPKSKKLIFPNQILIVKQYCALSNITKMLFNDTA